MKTWQLKFNYPKLIGLSTTVCTVTFISVLSLAATRVPIAIAQYSLPTAPSVYPPTTVSPFNGTWKLQWRRKRHSFDGILTMTGNTGTLTVSVRRPNGQVDVVHETMLLQPAGTGFILSGQNPVYAGTNTPIASYSPDSFLIEQASNLEGWSVKNCDSTERCSQVNMQFLATSASPPVVAPL